MKQTSSALSVTSGPSICRRRSGHLWLPRYPPLYFREISIAMMTAGQKRIGFGPRSVTALSRRRRRSFREQPVVGGSRVGGSSRELHGTGQLWCSLVRDRTLPDG